uniref:EamA domain-containing protein n=1 Tax=Chromera velia CCMP2878 TaxID=1169474 RepID=A0A0G4HJH9_9ALVE|eukprot:Cvel_7091.t1-p1 / transcript=Cvel_7091.t1 / gene=Cvel_7091 / organism=Chromera_velia_CCMP2878 / gene_product=Solute carrier family 35 member G1, putative / transcript_product=Solute carrier family 35 member G1, putative / location=Cvel_scaffold363:38275-39705(+) / protein_length=477 / sequence_SO=supercontig / SO=protein_coding / is_pseudo=false
MQSEAMVSAETPDATTDGATDILNSSELPERQSVPTQSQDTDVPVQMEAQNRAEERHMRWGRRRTVGLIFVVVSAVVWSTNGYLVTVTTDAAGVGFSVLTVSFVLAVVSVAAFGVSVLANPRLLRVLACIDEGVGVASLVLTRHVCSATALVLIYQAYGALPLGSATALLCSSPVWTALIAFVWLREVLNWKRILGAIGAVGGVVLITRDEEGGQEKGGMTALMGICAALVAAGLLSMATVITRKIRRQQPPIVLLGGYGVTLGVGCAVSAAVSSTDLIPVSKGPVDWLVVGLTGLTGFSANLLVAESLRRVDASVVNVIATLEVAFSFVWQICTLARPASLTAVCGSVLILACSALVWRPEERSTGRSSASPNESEASTSASGPPSGFALGSVGDAARRVEPPTRNGGSRHNEEEDSAAEERPILLGAAQKSFAPSFSRVEEISMRVGEGTPTRRSPMSGSSHGKLIERQSKVETP